MEHSEYITRRDAIVSEAFSQCDQPMLVVDGAGRIVLASDGATVRFSRIYENLVGIRVNDAADIHQNQVFRNTEQGILVSNGNTVNIVNNTMKPKMRSTCPTTVATPQVLRPRIAGAI